MFSSYIVEKRLRSNELKSCYQNFLNHKHLEINFYLFVTALFLYNRDHLQTTYSPYTMRSKPLKRSIGSKQITLCITCTLTGTMLCTVDLCLTLLIIGFPKNNLTMFSCFSSSQPPSYLTLFPHSCQGVIIYELFQDIISGLLRATKEHAYYSVPQYVLG